MQLPVRMRRTGLRNDTNARLVSAGFTALLALTVFGMRPIPVRHLVQAAKPSTDSLWVPVSDSLLKSLADTGKKIGYPGGAAGVSVDRASGDLRIVVPDQGIWQSSDKGRTFARLDAEISAGDVRPDTRLTPILRDSG